MALLVIAFACDNVAVQSGATAQAYGSARFDRHVATLFGEDGRLSHDRETLLRAARQVLIQVLSCRENRSKSGLLALVAGQAIGADRFLPNMGTEGFLAALSRGALEASCAGTPVLPRARVKDTRAALVDHFTEVTFLHPSALFAPAAAEISQWVATSLEHDDAENDADPANPDTSSDTKLDTETSRDEPWPIAAE
jgi:ParB family chromosome partitioning protein